MTPQRIQRKRARGWKMPENTVYVGRPTKWGNPVKVDNFGDGWYVRRGAHILGKFKNEKAAMQHAVNCFQDILDYMQPSDYAEFIQPLQGKNLACWCKPDQPCHADVLLALANRRGV